MFLVMMGHNNLKYFLEQKDPIERQHKWVSRIQVYDFYVEYVKGKYNIAMDALSKKPTTCSLMKIPTDWKSHLLVEYSKKKIAC